jgi:antitoxin ParD1/3/4
LLLQIPIDNSEIEGMLMSKNTSLVLGEELDVFIQAQIKKGRFGSASEAMRAGLRLLEEQELKAEILRAAIIQGEKSGTAKPFNMEKFIAAKRRAAR